ncbi:MAG: hypothetical protein ACKV22_16765 [Bryobacteraceae bacterium]
MPKPSLREQGTQLLKHVLPAVIKPLHSLWHEIIGFMFLAFAVIGFFKGVIPYVGDGAKEPDAFGKLIVGSIFSLIMGGYGASSLWKARKISRS